MFVKVCGITRLADARQAARLGATALGFVFWPGSPRYVDPSAAAEIVAEMPEDVTSVGVFVNESAATIGRIAAATGIHAVQLHGDERPELAAAIERDVLRSVTLDTPAEEFDRWPAGTVFLLDAADPVRRGGTGRAVNVARAADVARRHRIVLAGGLTPDTVAAAITTVRPYGVDVSSGVEVTPGVKDHEKLARFLASARSALGDR